MCVCERETELQLMDEENGRSMGREEGNGRYRMCISHMKLTKAGWLLMHDAACSHGGI